LVYFQKIEFSARRFLPNSL